MWKKVGSIGPISSNDHKSNRSRDQNPIEQPFWQMTKQRMSESQIYFQGNDYFFNNHLNKVKDTDSIKYTSQQNIKINKLNHARSLKYLSSDYGQKEVRKKHPNFDQIQQRNNRLNEDSFSTPQKNHITIDAEKKIKTAHSTERIQSLTSIDKKVATPQLNFSQIITEQIPLHKKVQTKKSIEMLRKQHCEIKEVLESELTQFRNDCHSMQTQMSNQILRVMNGKAQNSSVMYQQQTIDNVNNRKLKCQQLLPQTKKFAEKFRSLNVKKAELAEKYKSFRVK